MWIKIIITLIILILIFINIININEIAKKYYNKNKNAYNINEIAINYYNINAIILNQSIENITPINQVIPLNIFTTWHTKKLTPSMMKAITQVKTINPEFKYYLFDENDCIEFIKNNFDKDVLDAYNNLIPLAYKADLWRYCILYIYGGIYMDIKFIPVNNFKFINLTDKEYFCLERPGPWKQYSYGLINGLIISKPKNTILLDCINKIVDNVKTKNYEYNPLYPTGPGLLGDIYFSKYNNLKSIELFFNIDIIYKNTRILKMYDNYRTDQSSVSPIPRYDILWENKQIYL
jgi:mannosyltransferase OCH1-like enzyme